MNFRSFCFEANLFRVALRRISCAEDEYEYDCSDRKTEASAVGDAGSEPCGQPILLTRIDTHHSGGRGTAPNRKGSGRGRRHASLVPEKGNHGDPRIDQPASSGRSVFVFPMMAERFAEFFCSSAESHSTSQSESLCAALTLR